jgi:putative ABC transport system permease protein
MFQDFRSAWRSLRTTPRLTLAATACAALGLGAAIFMTTLVDAVLFATPPLPDADRLVRVWTSSTTTHERSDVSYADVLDIRARARSFDAVEAVVRTRLALTTDAGTERIRGESVTPGYFALIGIRPALGRLFDAAEYAPDTDRPVIISHNLWQRRFGGRTDVIGELLRPRPTARQAPDTVRTIVGVMPPGFVGTVDPDVSDFWIPVAHFAPAAVVTVRTQRSTWMLARLAPGVSLGEAQAEIAAIAAGLAAEHPVAFDRVTLVAEPFGESWRERFRLSLFTLLAAAGLLLLIACTNIATLLLARLAQREGELRVRVALGAPRARLVRQLLAESVLIAVVGGVAGLALAGAGIRTVAAAGVFTLPPYVQIGVEPRSAAAGFALVLVTGLLFGVLPATLGSGAQAATVGGHAGVRVSLGRRQRRYGQALVVAQVAFTFLLLASAALLARTYQALVGGDLGYRTENLLRMAVTPDPNVYGDVAARVALASEIKRAFEAYPGVQRTAVIAGVLPPWFDATVDVDLGPDDRLRDVGRHAVGPDYFDVMGMRVVAGRGFEIADRAPGASIAIASESLARRLRDATGRDAVGQRVQLRREQTPAMDPELDTAGTLEIVGVVNDVVYNGPLRPRPADLDLYVPLEAGNPGALSIALHTTIDPALLIDPLSRELGRLAPSSPQHWISTMEGELGLQFQDARLYASLSGFYGVAAALLAVLGIYSVLANDVARRRHELGVRLAVGAGAFDIVRLVLAEGIRTLVAGVAIGAALALLGTRLLEGLLYGVASRDPATFAVVSLGLITAGLLACAVPSIRAARVDPLSVLRSP